MNLLMSFATDWTVAGLKPNPDTLDAVTEKKISDARIYDRGFSLIGSSSTTLAGLQAHKIEIQYKLY